MPGTWLYPHATSHTLCTPLCLVLKKHLFFMHLLLVCILKFLLNSLMPFSMWFWIWMIASLVKIWGSSSVGLVSPVTMATSMKKIKFSFTFFLSYFFDNFVGIIIIWCLLLFIACTTFALAVVLGVASISSLTSSSKRFSFSLLSGLELLTTL